MEFDYLTWSRDFDGKGFYNFSRVGLVKVEWESSRNDKGEKHRPPYTFFGYVGGIDCYSFSWVEPRISVIL